MAKTQTDAATRKAVVDYYDGSWFDYRLIWLNGDNLGKHFGYWEPETKSQAESLINMNRQTALRVDPKPGQRVLDAGCGVGGSSMWLARNYGVDTVGISISAKEVERARKYTAKRGLQGQCTFEQQDYINTNFPDNSFDIVWAQESSCHSPHKDLFVKEAFRVLKPGGKLVLEDWYRTGRPFHPADEKLIHHFLGCWAIPDIPTQQEITGYMADSGFTEIRFDDVTPYMLRSARHLYLITAWLYPGAFLLRWMRLRTKVLHDNLRAARGQWRAHVRGLWIGGIVVAQKPERSHASPAGSAPAESAPEPVSAN